MTEQTKLFIATAKIFWNILVALPIAFFACAFVFLPYFLLIRAEKDFAKKTNRETTKIFKFFLMR